MIGNFTLRHAGSGAVLGFLAMLAAPTAMAGPIPDCGAGNGGTAYSGTGSSFECIIGSGGTFSLYAIGANGGDQRIDNLPVNKTVGGKGAGIGGEFRLNAGDILRVLVGLAGQTHVGEIYADEIYPGGGGGGTFVALSRAGQDFVPLLIAGGGGGAGTAGSGKDGRGLEDGNSAKDGSGGYDYAGSGGTNGAGGGGATTAAGGAGGGGSLTAGGGSQSADGGASFLDGGAGGGPKTQFCFGAAGGFGGGGGAGWSDCTQSAGAGGGGGGGYSGGGGGGWDFWGNNGGAGGGGSSYYDPDFLSTGLTVQPGINTTADGSGWFEIDQLSDSNGNPVPEPSVVAVMGIALGALGWRRRR